MHHGAVEGCAPRPLGANSAARAARPRRQSSLEATTIDRALRRIDGGAALFLSRVRRRDPAPTIIAKEAARTRRRCRPTKARKKLFRRERPACQETARDTWADCATRHLRIMIVMPK
jgi:hypothetical protein